MKPEVVFCKGCGIPMAPGERRPRLWCSSTCRARTQRGVKKPLVALALPPCASKVYYRDCLQCGRLFVARGWQQAICSSLCQSRRRFALMSPEAKKKAYIRARDNGNFVRAGKTYQQTEKGKTVNALRNRRRSAVTRGALVAERIVARDVYVRDNWICQLCQKPVEPRLAWPDPDSASLDHVVPITLGGLHVLGNVQLAHLHCNQIKGNRVKVGA